MDAFDFLIEQSIEKINRLGIEIAKKTTEREKAIQNISFLEGEIREIGKKLGGEPVPMTQFNNMQTFKTRLLDAILKLEAELFMSQSEIQQLLADMNKETSQKRAYEKLVEKRRKAKDMEEHRKERRIADADPRRIPYYMKDDSDN